MKLKLLENVRFISIKIPAISFSKNWYVDNLLVLILFLVDAFV